MHYMQQVYTSVSLLSTYFWYQLVTGIKPGTSLWSFQTSVVFDTTVDTIIDISLWPCISDHLTLVKTHSVVGKWVLKVSGHHPIVFGEDMGNGPRTKCRQRWKKKNMAVLLQWRGLEKLDMFNIFTKLGIFSLLGCEFPTNCIRLRKSVLLGNMLLRQ